MNESQLKETENNKALMTKILLGIYLSIISLVCLSIWIFYDLSPERQQALFAIIAISLIATLDIFRKTTDSDETPIWAEDLIQTNIYGDQTNISEVESYISRNHIERWENYRNISQQDSLTNQLTIPPNYFDVVKTIELIPDRLDLIESNSPSIKDILVKLQAYIESEPQLSMQDKAMALEQVKTLAEEAKNPKKDQKEEAKKAIESLSKFILNNAYNQLLNLISELLWIH